jgi:RNA polymerase sigma factor (sigma-70 family)
MAVRTPWKAPPRRAPAELEREEDHRLAMLASEGDEAAFEAIFERHHRGLLTLSRHMLGSREEAEDALQHTFAAAYRQLTETGPPEHMRAWLYATARNRCSSLLRARRELPRDQLPAATVWLPEEVERRSDLRDLLDDIQRLPEDQRVALVLAEIEDLDHAEVSEVLGCRRDKVRSLVFQARATLGGWREARATPCREVREELATARGPELRRAHLRRHLAVCTDCTAFREEVDQQRRRVALLLPPIPIAVALKESIVEAAIAGVAGGTAGGAGAAAGGAGGAAAEAAGGAAGGGAAAAAGGAAAGGGIATALKVGAAALVLGGAGAAGLGGLGGGGEDNPATPPPQPEREPAAEEPRRTEAASKPNRKPGGQSKASVEKRLRARERAQSASAGERTKKPTAAAPQVNTAGSAPRAPSVQLPSAQTPSARPPSPQVPSLPAPPAPPQPQAEAPATPAPPAPPQEPEVEISVGPPVEAPVEPPVQPPVEPPDLP